MNPSHTVFIVDDEAAVRKALRLMMTTAGYKVQEFASATEFLDAYDSTSIGCLVLDVRMPGMDGLALLRHLTKERVALPVIMLSAHGDIPMAVGAVKTGAVDFLEKPAQPSLLREKVAAALELAQQWHYDQTERQEILEGYAKLTARERQVAELLADGKSTETIAKILGTSQNTVRVQRNNIRNKMQAATAAELVKMINIIQGDISDGEAD
jgi:FixJ family two-component response regulator